MMTQDEKSSSDQRSFYNSRRGGHENKSQYHGGANGTIKALFDQVMSLRSRSLLQKRPQCSR